MKKDLRSSRLSPARSPPSLDFIGRQRVLKQHGNCHRPHPSWHRRDVACRLHRLVEVDVTHDPAVAQFVDADVDYNGTRLDPSLMRG